ncbi:hypothetical protein [Microbacterium marinilacus]|uniref:hypothetical protein n=1 Tax=Microbacterium marinilacus TaxID=415209 RepID=UPI0031D9E675|nr:hypothetical protein [Microbacterium marinilacus]
MIDRVPAPRTGAARAAATMTLVGALLSGCAAGGNAAPSPAAPSPAAPSGAAYDVVPEPGRTIDAAPSATLERLDGYRIAVIVPDDSTTSSVLLSAARTVAGERGADLVELPVDASAADPIGQALERALEVQPDVIAGLGEGVVDVLGFESAQLLDQQFLVVGAQLAEPTENVTAVIWDGATSRGSSAGADGDLDASSVTPQRGEAAFETGLASVRDGQTGIVLHLG